MRGFAAVLIVSAVLVLPLPATEPEDGATSTGDIDKYTPGMPPSVVIHDVYPGDIDTKVFILVEGALLVPDRIRFNDARQVYEIEVVNADELEGLEPVAEIRLPDTLDLAKARAKSQPGPEILRFEQRMWRQGLRLVVRDYQKPGAVVVRYTAFRVTFETAGELYRATVTLYTAQTTLKQHIDAVTRRIGDAVEQLEKVDRSVQKAGKETSEATDKLAHQIAAVETKLKRLESDVKAAEGLAQSVVARVAALEGKE